MAEHILPPEPWHAFFKELDDIVQEEAHLICVGGFVMTAVYGMPRTTSDVDVFSIAPAEARRQLVERAGQNSDLHKNHHVYLQYVGGVTSLPYDFDERLSEIYVGVYRNLRLFVPDPHDLALSKFARNQPRDREDARYLLNNAPLDLAVLQKRYREEFRQYLFGVKENHDANFEMWMEMLEEARNK